MHLTLSEIFGEYKDNITVNLYLKTHNGEAYSCRMIAHEGDTSRPKIYLTDLPLDNKKSHIKYFCQKILIENNPEYRILTTPDEVAEQFTLKKENNGRYSQYIGVPLTDSNNNTVALLEINVLNNTKIFDNYDDGMELIRNHLNPFVSMFMLSLNLLGVINKKSNNIKEGKIDD